VETSKFLVGFKVGMLREYYFDTDVTIPVQNGIGGNHGAFPYWRECLMLYSEKQPRREQALCVSHNGEIIVQGSEYFCAILHTLV
jgi:hypothetical protein